MTETLPTEGQVPSQDERTMAVLAHALQMAGWFVAPLIIFATKRQSRFVAFHALQALIFQLLYLTATFVIVGSFMATMILTVANQPSAPHAPPAGPPLAVFILFPFIWIVMMGFWVVALVFAILYSIKAGKGEWAAYPVIGCWARKVLKIAPDGTPLPIS